MVPATRFEAAVSRAMTGVMFSRAMLPARRRMFAGAVTSAAAMPVTVAPEPLDAWSDAAFSPAFARTRRAVGVAAGQRAADEVGGDLADHDRGGVGVAADDAWA